MVDLDDLRWYRFLGSGRRVFGRGETNAGKSINKHLRGSGRRVRSATSDLPGRGGRCGRAVIGSWGAGLAHYSALRG
jgi:hypothetical protein